MSTLLPQGFLYAGETAGIKVSGKKDLGLVYCPKPAIMGAVYTKNRFPSAHVLYCRPLTPNPDFRALLVNSGNANAATGIDGDANNLRMVKTVAKAFDLQESQILTSSTGVIGQRLPIEVIEDKITELPDCLSEDPENFSQAILTTDLKSKVVSTSFHWEGKVYQILGICKGSGMIEPNMATMLAYVMTDAPIHASQIQALTHQISDFSFNCLSVDGDTSTSDSFYMISSQPSEKAMPRDYIQALEECLSLVAKDLTKKIAADGEGAEHLLEVTVQGSDSILEAKSVMKSILNSSLVKTAVHGRDPNWGRLLMAIGNGLIQEADCLPIDISVQGVAVYKQGEPQQFDAAALSELMRDFHVSILVDLRQGDHEITGWGCDLSREYIRINADYTT